MKWSKKGHEFDQTWEAIRAGKRLYLFGAGEYGALVFHILRSCSHSFITDSTTLPAAASLAVYAEASPPGSASW